MTKRKNKENKRAKVKKKKKTLALLSRWLVLYVYMYLNVCQVTSCNNKAIVPPWMFIGRVKFQFQLASLELRIVRLGIFAPPTNKVPNVCRLILGETVFHKQVDFFGSAVFT